MKNTKQIIVFLTFVAFGFFILQINPVLAGADLLGTEYGKFSGLGDRDLRNSVGTIIQVFLSLLGVISLGVILYAGFMWMTAGGNEESITKAKKTLWAAVIGLIIILSAYAVTSFVLSNIYRATTGYTL